MSTNWGSRKKSIPSRVHVGGKDYYEIVWVDSFSNPDTLGETRFSPNQIAIKNGQSDKETVMTYLHECIHAFDAHNNIGLTETQVLKLEKALLIALKNNNIFVKGKK